MVFIQTRRGRYGYSATHSLNYHFKSSIEQKLSNAFSGRRMRECQVWNLVQLELMMGLLLLCTAYMLADVTGNKHVFRFPAFLNYVYFRSYYVLGVAISLVVI